MKLTKLLRGKLSNKLKRTQVVQKVSMKVTSAIQKVFQ